MIHTKSSLPLAALAALLTACSSTPVAPPPAPAPMKTAPAPMPSAPAPTPAATPRPLAQSSVTTVTLPAYLDPKNSIATERSVYFDFDDFTVKPEYNGLVERHGKFLASNPKVAIKIEGNADERGGAEYNLALGQKRAEALLRALKVYGATESQLEATSWGKSKPKATGHDEAAWAQNRRDDLQYPTR